MSEGRNRKHRALCCVLECLCRWLGRVLGCKGGTQGPPREVELARVVVKFSQQVTGLPYRDGAEDALGTVPKVGERLAGAWKRLSGRSPGIRLRPVFTSASVEDLRRIEEQARETDPDFFPRFEAYYYVAVARTPGTPQGLLKEIATEFGGDVIEELYVDWPSGRPGTVARTLAMEPPSYIDVPAVGIGTEQAWQAGFNGSGLTLVVSEHGCLMSHPNLTGITPLGSGVFSDSRINREHGTAVVSVIAAQPNLHWQNEVEENEGIAPEQLSGLAPAASVLLGSPRISNGSGGFNIVSEDVVIAATRRKTIEGKPVHVVLVEEQSEILGSGNIGTGINVLAEGKRAAYNAIRAAADVGIAVIEVAGNDYRGLATVNMNLNDHSAILDNQLNPTGRSFDPSSAQFDDSRAIVVSAVDSQVVSGAHQRRLTASHGGRVDVYAWGENAKSCTLDEADVTLPGFVLQPKIADTSAAAAIVTGAVLLMQHMSMQHRGRVLEPLQVRELLRNCGTPVTGTNRFIPDLAKLCRAIRGIPANDVSAATATTVANEVQAGGLATPACW